MVTIKKHDFENSSFLRTMIKIYEGCSALPLPAEWDALPAGIEDYMQAVYKAADQQLKVKKWEGSYTTRGDARHNGRDLMVGFSGGKDSLATALWGLEKGYDVTLFHVKGVNPSYPNEVNHAVTLAGELPARLIIKQVKLTGRSDFMENPVKNQLILAAMIAWGYPQGIANYALGDFWDDTLDKSNIICNLSDARELWLGIESYLGDIYNPFSYKHIFNNYSETYLQILRTRPDLLEQVLGCMAPLRYRAGYRQHNESKYKLNLLPGRCGSCWKCCAEYLVLYKFCYEAPVYLMVNLLKLATLKGYNFTDDAFRDKCIAYLRKVMPREKPFIKDPKALTGEQVAALFAPEPRYPENPVKKEGAI